jgi:hypothetical protein
VERGGAAEFDLAPGPGWLSRSPVVAVARVGDVVLLDHSADNTGPRSINCYLVDVQDAAKLGGASKRSKIDPQRVLYSLQ